MKKQLSLLMLSVIVAFASCTKEQDLGSQKGKEVDARISVQLPAQANMTRAAYAEPTLSDMRVVLAVMYDNVVVHTETKTDQGFGNGSTSVNFDLRLVTGQSYKVAVWADFGASYYTVSTDIGGTPKIALANTTLNGSDNKHDAYFKIDDVTFAAANEVKPFVLKRPFGLVKINTLDNDVPSVVNTGLRAAFYQIASINAPTELSLLDGTVSKNENLKIDWSSVSSAVGDGTPKELSFDYFLSGETQSPLSDFTVAYKNSANKDVTSYEFTNIPLRRNYITNITGNILTKQGSISVTIDPIMSGEIIVTEATNSTDFASEITKAENENKSVFDYKMKESVAADAGQSDRTYSIPDAVAGNVIKEINFNFSQGISVPVTIKDYNPANTANNFAGTITVVVPDGTLAASLPITFEVPAAHLVVKSTNGTIIKEVIATTSSETLVIEEGVTIEKLTVKGGNIENRGTIKDIVIDAGKTNVVIDNTGAITGKITTVGESSYTLSVAVSTAQELRETMVNPMFTGATLMADIKWESLRPGDGAGDNQDAFRIGKNDVGAMEFYDPRPMDGFVLNGNGHTISGIAYNNVMAVYAHNVTIKNLTIEQTAEQKTTRPNGGLSIYRSTGVILENVTIRNTGKAGLSINAATAKATGLHTSANLWGGVDITKGGAPAGGNKPVFEFDETSTFGEDPEIYISIDRTGNDYEVKAPATWMSGYKYYPSGAVIFIYSSTPFTPVVIAPADKSLVAVDPNAPSESGKTVILDGVLFTTGTNIYPTIEAALTSVIANGTVKVAAGTYTAPVSGNSQHWNLGSAAKAGVKIEGNATNRPVLNGTITMYGNSQLKNVVINNVNKIVGGSVNAIVLLIGANQVIENVKWNAAGNPVTPSGGQKIYPIVNDTGNGDGLTVKGCEFVGGSGTNNYSKAIYLNPGAKNLMSDVTLTGNIFTGLTPVGCDSWMPNFTCTGNSIPKGKDVGFYRNPANGDAAATSTANFSAELKATINMCLNQNTWTAGWGYPKVKTWGVGGTIEVTSTLN